MYHFVAQRQATIKNSFSLRGIGIHSGGTVSVTVLPAEGGGIRFTCREEPTVVIPACVEAHSPLPHCTALASGGQRVLTIEHLLAVLWVMGVDHATVLVEGGELPGLDGSALEYVRALQRAGLRALDGARAVLKLPGPIWVRESNAHLVALPASHLRVTYVLEYPHPQIGRQMATLSVSPESFAAEVAPARTFGFAEWAEALRARGLAKGASPENTVVITPEGFLSPLRYPEEFARHKLLDLLGDLALLGRPLHAHVLSLRGGHATNVQLVRRILEKGILVC